MIEARWIAAQVGERVFHVEDVPGWGSVEERRTREAEMRRWYAGMLRIPHGDHDADAPSVTDFGCGPQSLLLSSRANRVASIGVDPLRFTDADEATYSAAGITRHIGPAETYTGPETEEAWMYNCLQHTMEPSAVIAAAAKVARHTIRIFEWVEVPTDTLHLHTLHEADLRNALVSHGYSEMYMVRGEAASHPHWAQPFYSGVWTR
jgi:hypothetical protein